MAATSFKKDFGARPLRYRTPSPPRYAVEPLSPVIPRAATEHSGVRSLSTASYHSREPEFLPAQCRPLNGRFGRREQHGAMDAFASIALASSSHSTPRRSSHHERTDRPSTLLFEQGEAHSDRPAKRAKSEKLPSPHAPRMHFDTRAGLGTGPQETSDDRFLEAELLLNFAQEARFTVPLKSSLYNPPTKSPHRSIKPPIHDRPPYHK